MTSPVKGLAGIFSFNGCDETLVQSGVKIVEESSLNRAVGAACADEKIADVAIVNDVLILAPGDSFNLVGVNLCTGPFEHPLVKFVSSDCVLTGIDRQCSSKKVEMQAVKFGHGVGVFCRGKIQKIENFGRDPAGTHLASWKNRFVEEQGGDGPFF